MVETNPSGTVLKTQYLHADHQGSIKAVSDTSGAVIERMGYDAWGKRSDALSHSTTRGYTAHEMLDNVGLIHMNGGVYDPLLARFLSVDPINQAPDNAQSYNPYSYVFNSPMMFTDPSGFSAWAKYRRPVVGAIAFVATYGVASAMMGAAALEAGASTALANVTLLETQGTLALTGLTTTGDMVAGSAAGFVSGGIQSGTMEGALRGAVVGGLSAGVGSTAGGYGMAGRMIGGGVNGALSTRSWQGFLRGMAGGMLPNDLGMTDYYNNYASANLAIGLMRDGVRGVIAADSRRGFGPGVAFGQVNNLVGHTIGLASTRSLPTFIKGGGSFIYEGKQWEGNGAITFGNVASGPPGLSGTSSWLYRHEYGHIYQGNLLGALYAPVHGLSMFAGIVGNTWETGSWSWGAHHESWNLFENTLNQEPHNHSTPNTQLIKFLGG